ncbi:MAG: DNA repair protein RecO [Lachnospiraceae bacterium]|jgi:DNA repair protein RecO (recombination protein O)|nr:DNA repair protein RecO [Lachnospiraceae bacterium]NBJ82447.1 DNA repair protein RecO [bacterium 1XD42-76]NBK05740.1 DNA repair protein RecO [bacterium 1XD42-94]
MKEKISVVGVVLKASPVGEYDKRLVLLCRERGKITVFARGARRPGSPLMACACPFVTGIFKLYEGRDAYSLAGAEVTGYFREIAGDMEAACYGSYFLEFADYYARENLEAGEMANLVYLSLRALLKPALSKPLVRAAFELKLMELNGEYTELPPLPCSPPARYAWEYILSSPVARLFTFTLTEPVQEEFLCCVEENRKRFVDKSFHSLDILGVLVDNDL